METRIIMTEGEDLPRKVDPALLKAVARAKVWFEELASGRVRSLEQMRGQLRPNAFLRLVENRWVTSESTFVPMEWWDRCVDADLRPELADMKINVWIGLDASVKRDSTAIVCCTFDRELKKVRLVWHRIFQPSPEHPLDFENTVEKNLLALRRMFYIREVKFDPYQLQSVSQRLTAQGLPMVEFPQSVPNLTESSTNLYELVKGRNLQVYPDDEVRLAISRCVAALGAVQQQSQSHEYSFTPANPGEFMFYPPNHKPGPTNDPRSPRTRHQQENDWEDAQNDLARKLRNLGFGRSRHGLTRKVY